MSMYDRINYGFHIWNVHHRKNAKQTLPGVPEILFLNLIK